MNLSLRPFQKKDLQHLHRWSSAVGAGRFMQKVTPLNYQEPADLSSWERIMCGMPFSWMNGPSEVSGWTEDAGGLNRDPRRHHRLP